MANEISARLLDEEANLASDAVTNIISARPMYTLQQLDNVPQVGPSSLQTLRDFVPLYVGYVREGGDVSSGIAFTASQVSATLGFANTATSAQLQQVSGIASVTATAIIASRPYLDIPGIDTIVTTTVLRNLRDYTAPTGSVDSVVVEGVEFTAAEASAVLALVNTATKETLVIVPSVDSVKASNIIAARPIATVNALGDVPLVGSETLRNLRFYVDGAPGVTDGLMYAAYTTSLRVSAADSGVGVMNVESNLDSTGYAVVAVRTSFVEGLHALAYRSTDLLGNLEGAKARFFAADSSVPVVAVSIGVPQAFGGSTFGTVVRSTTDVTATATDPDLPGGPMGGVWTVTTLPGAGVQSLTWWSRTASDPGTATPVSGAIYLAVPGTQTLRIAATDNVGNASETECVFTVDDLAPVISEPVTVGGRTYTARQDSIVISVNVSDTDPNPAISMRLVDQEDSTVITVSNGEAIEPLSIDDGFWRLEVSATDWVGNSRTLVSEPFQVIHDIQPPRTSASVGAPKAVGGVDGSASGEMFVTSAASIGLSAVDDLVIVYDGVGLGVAKTEFAWNGGMMVVGASTTATGVDGLRALSYRSVDILENTEETRSLTLHLDNTAPGVNAEIGGPQASDSRGTFVASSTPVRFQYRDAGVGIAGALAETVYLSAEGAQTVARSATDLLGNRAETGSISVIVDNTAPVSTFSISHPLYDANGDRYITPTSQISFAAQDGAGVGVDRLEVVLDSGSFASYASAISFQTEGRHQIQYRAVDRLGNVEAIRMLDVIVDASGPVSMLGIGMPNWSGDSKTYVTSATPFTLTAVDQPVSSSGLASTMYRIDAGSSVVGMNFTVAGLDGQHIIAFHSTDALGNVEPERSQNIVLDNTAPIVTVEVGTPKFTDGLGRIVGTSATTITLTAVDSGTGVGSFSIALDSGILTNFTSGTSLTFATQGEHVVAWQASDRLDHAVTGTFRIIIDNARPRTTLQISPSDTTGRIWIPESLITLNAIDSGAAGLATTEWRIDSGEYQAFSSPFEIGAVLGQYGDTGPKFGLHTFTFRSADRVGNSEPESTVSFILSPALAVTKTRSFASRTLVWWNCNFEKEGRYSRHAPAAIPQRAVIEETIRSESLLMDTVTTAANFVSRMRTGRYNVFVILGEKHKLSVGEENELAERVNMGAGVIASVWNRIRGPWQGHDHHGGEEAIAADNVLGVKVAGRVRDEDERARILAGIMADTAYDITLVERARRVKENVGDVIATFPDVDERGHCHGDEHHGNGHDNGPDADDEGDEDDDDEADAMNAAAVHRQYGLGEAIFFAFDLAKNATGAQTDTVLALLRRSLKVVSPETEPAITGGLVAVEIRVKSLVVPMNLNISIDELLPSDVTLLSATPSAVLSGGAMVWTVLLDVGKETSVKYTASLPMVAGSVNTEARISYLVRGTYRNLGTYRLTVATQDAATNLTAAKPIIESIVSRVSSQGGDRSRAQDALQTVTNLLAHPPSTATGRGNAVEDLLEAVGDLLRIENAAVRSDALRARNAMDLAVMAYSVLGVN